MSTGLQNAYGIVNQGWDQYSTLATDTFQEALDINDQLQSFKIDPFQFTLSFNPPPDQMQGFTPPAPPEAPEIGDYTVTPVEPLGLDIPSMPEFPGAPGEPPEMEDRPEFGDSPQILTPEDLQIPDPPKFDDIKLPDQLTLDYIDPPEDFFDINTGLEAPTLNKQLQFEGVRPGMENKEPPPAFIDFEEGDYESELLDRTRDEILEMLENGTGMPVLVEQLLVDRAREREDVEAQRATEEAVERWVSRGFNMPSGVVNKEVAKVRQDSRDKVSTMSREVFLQRRKEEIENFRFAIAQGIALENILIQKHLNVMARAFDLARAVVDLEYREFEARIAIFNVELQAFRVDADVYRTLLEAEAQKIALFRAELEAEALKGQLNRDKVAFYVAQVEALNSQVALYRAEIEAARTIVQTYQTEAQLYATQIQGAAQRVEAKNAEFRGWATKVQGELGKVQAFEAETRAFAAQVQAYDTEVRATLAEPQLEVQIRELEVREFLARLEHKRTEIQKELGRWQAESTLYGAEGSVYAAHGQIALNQSEASNRQFQTKLRESELLANQETQNVQLQITQIRDIAQLLIGALESAGQGKSQLAAGAMSAVSLSADIRAGATESWGRSASFEGITPVGWGGF